VLFIMCHSKTTSAKFRPRWQIGPGTGAYTVLKAYATYLPSTGLSCLTLPMLFGRWARLSWSFAGTSTNISAWAVLRGQM
jgi:hypothetical protein